MRTGNKSRSFILKTKNMDRAKPKNDTRVSKMLREMGLLQETEEIGSRIEELLEKRGICYSWNPLVQAIKHLLRNRETVGKANNIFGTPLSSGDLVAYNNRYSSVGGKTTGIYLFTRWGRHRLINFRVSEHDGSLGYFYFDSFGTTCGLFPLPEEHVTIKEVVDFSKTTKKVLDRFL
jgi:hypothetical protein